MKNINITVENKRAAVVGSPVIVCGNSDYTVTFAFDNEWSLTGPKTARFVYVKRGEVMHEDVLFDGNTVAVPVLSDVTFVNVGVFAGDLCTTTPARVNCHPSILCGSGIVQAPTPDVYSQIMALFESMAEKGAFGATEEQMQLVEQNRQAIAALEAGTKKAGDANKLGGHEASYFATAQSMTDLENGTKKAGDANKLGGHEAEYFASAEAVKNNALWNELTSGFDLNNALGKYRTQNSSIVASISNAPSGMGASGEINIEWYPSASNNSYGMQILRQHTNGKSKVWFRTKDGTTWNIWNEVATTAELAKYLPLESAMAQEILVNSAVIAKLRSKTGNKVMLHLIGTDGTTGYLGTDGVNIPVFQTTGGVVQKLLHTGNMASYVLPKTGGKITGTGYFPFEVEGTSSYNENYIRFSSNGTVLGSLGFYGANNPRFVSTDGVASHLLHTGNSAKVHVGTSAPSDTTSVWFDTSSL